MCLLKKVVIEYFPIQNSKYKIIKLQTFIEKKKFFFNTMLWYYEIFKLNNKQTLNIFPNVWLYFLKIFLSDYLIDVDLFLTQLLDDL